MNLPKFIYDDVSLFLGLIMDLFPGLECQRIAYPEFSRAVIGEIQKNSFIPMENQVN